MIAEVNGSLHIRIFSGEGEMVVDADEKRLLISGKETIDFAHIRQLRKTLNRLWPPHDVDRAERHRVVCFVASLVGYVLPRPPRDQSIRLEIGLHRGIWIEGKITERASGRPVEGCLVHYEAFIGNRSAGRLPEFFDLDEVGDFYEQLHKPRELRTKADGTYRLVGLPGGGIVGVYYSNEPYLQEGYGGLDKQRHFRIVPGSPGNSPVELLGGSMFPTPVEEINPPENAESHRVDLQLNPGGKVRLRVLDLHRRPVAGVGVTVSIPPRRIFKIQQSSAEFDVQPIEPGPRRLVVLSQPERGVGKVIEVGTGDDRNGPVDVRLDPLAKIEGRVSDAAGKPAPFVNIRAYVRNHWDLSLAEVSTDRNGRFVVSSVPVGHEYEIDAQVTETNEAGAVTISGGQSAKPVVVRPGQTSDAGEIRLGDAP